MRRETDPVGGFRFALELGFLEVASFSECTGLAMETKLFEYREGGRNSSPLKLPEVGGVANVTLKRGVVTGETSDALFTWHRDVMTGSFDAADNPNRRPADTQADLDRQVAIVLQDEAGNEIKRWRLFRALPVKWVAPELKAAASEIAIETLELACEDVEVA